MKIEKIIFRLWAKKTGENSRRGRFNGEIIILASEVNIRKVHLKDGVLRVLIKPKVIGGVTDEVPRVW
jgi:hypothetical protein